MFVIGSLQGGGAEHVLTTVCNNLAERGHEVILVYNFNWKAYSVSDKVRQIDTNTFEHDTAEGCLLKRYYNKFVNRFRGYSFFCRFIKEEKPAAVTCFLQNWTWQLAFICKGRVPLVYSERNTFDWKYNNLTDKLCKKIWYHFGDAVTVMTYYDKAYLRNRYKNVFVMHNPLSYTPLSKEEYIQSFPLRKNILACGRLVPNKGFDKLITAFSAIAGEFPEWDVNIAGQDMQHSNYSTVLKDLVHSHGLDRRIHFIGFHKDMDNLMKQHSVFCLCSQHEGFPNVLSEALSMGMAAVSFDVITGPREIIIDGLDGIIVENQNVDALKEGLRKVLADSELRKNLGLKAIEDIQRFRPSDIIDKWEAMYKSLVKKYHK
ncbi:transferase [Bacteroides graminisolvens DSM 19988 = JCM 15093]|uniref:Transferase n=2 Tax=Bacteroides graminisolvens TaxID=477666 RepID=A0A069D7G6_9BACE|nr:transferase [Bacteroides graminisolvens DSM 19988 = JCM 15093]